MADAVSRLDRARIYRWLWPLACIIALGGYFGPWVPHAVAGLVVTGLDLGEYVKFLPEVIDGTVYLWRQGFYFPLVAVSMTCSLLAYRSVFGYPLLIKLTMILLGAVAALNILPPAWTPAVLRSDEFLLQTIVIGICLATLLLSPLLARIPGAAVYAFLTIGCILAVWFPVSGFTKVLPSISQLYGRDIQSGWGVYVLSVGLLLLLSSYWISYVQERRLS